MNLGDETGSALKQTRRAVGHAVEAAVDAVSGVLNAASGAVEAVVRVVCEFFADLYTSSGNGIADLFNLIGSELKKNPITGWLGEILGWIGDIVGAVFTFLGDFIKFIASCLVGVVKGLINLVRAIITLDGHLIQKGLADIASGILGGLLVALGSLVSVVQTIIPGQDVQGKRRALSKNEIQLLKTIFHNSVALYNIRVIDGNSGVYQVNNRAFALGNTIYMKRTNTSLPGEIPTKTNERYLSVLAHEVLHVWQYQTIGSQYAMEALGAQFSFPNAYDWEQEINSGRTEWIDFNMEAQGQFIEDLFKMGELLTSPPQKGNGAFFKGDASTQNRYIKNSIEHTLRANNALAAIRGKKTFRSSLFLTR